MDPLEEDDEGYEDVEDTGFCHRCPSPTLPAHPLLFSFTERPHPLPIPSNNAKEEVIPWDDEEITRYFPDRNLSWDNLKVPIPYRYQPEHLRIATGGSESIQVKQFVSQLDSKALSEQFVEIFWRKDVVTLSLQPEAIAALRECLQEPVYISVKQFIQSTFHLLAGRASQIFIQDPKTNVFKKNAAYLVNGLSPSALWNLSLPFCKCGSIVERFSRYSTYDGKRFKEEGFESNAVALAFIKFVTNYLKIYQTVLWLNSSNIGTFTQLIRFIKPFQSQLEMLDQIWWSCGSSHKAVDLLSHLNWLVFVESEPHRSTLIKNLFITCASAYLKYVSSWIFHGQLGTRSEFHVVRLREYSYRDRRYWTKQFVHANTVPEFLKDSSALVFETGKAISLLNEIQSDRVYQSIPLLKWDSAETVLSPVFTFEDAENLYLEWNTKLELFRETQANYIAAISQAIHQVASKCSLSLLIEDDERMEKLKADLALNCAPTRLELRERKRIKQKQQLSDLNQQVAENQARLSRDLESEKLFDLQNLEYIAMRDKRDEEEQKRMDVKHFGEDFVRPTQKGFFHRLHSGNGPDSVDADNESLLMPSTSVHQVDEEGDKVDVALDTIIKECSLQRTEEFQDSILVNIETEELLNQEESCVVIETEEDLDLEKFNPDKILLPSPPPYSTDHIELTSSMTSDISLIGSLFSSASTKIPRKTKLTEENSINRDEHCMNLFLSESVSIPLRVQNEITNMAILHYFVCEKKLFHHLEALNNFLCLQNGLFGYTLNELLIQEVDQSRMQSQADIAGKIGRLNIILAEAIGVSVVENEEDNLTQNLGLSLNVQETKQTTTSSKSISSVYNILDSIRLCYKVEWPLNIIFTEELLHQYERLFNFQMKLLRVELLLQKCFINMKKKDYRGSQLFILHNHRTRLLHFVRTIRNYVNVTVIQCDWEALCSSFKSMDSLDKIYENFVRHIKTINTNCLLGVKAEGLMKLLIDQLVIIETFCSQVNTLDPNVEISDHAFKRLGQKFKAIDEIGKVFLEVAYKLVQKGIYSKVSYFLELYNFNGFFQIRKREGSKHNITVTTNC